MGPLQRQLGRGGVEERRVVLALAKAELAWVQRERDKACSGRDTTARGVATTVRERDEARARGMWCTPR